MFMRFLSSLLLLLAASAANSSYSQWGDPNRRMPALTWQKCLGGTGIDKANDVLLTNDGGMVLVGLSNSTDGDVTGNHGGYDGWVVKLTASGSIEWQLSAGGSAEDELTSVIKTNDGNYLCFGKTKSSNGDISGFHGETDCWILKISASGHIIWSKVYGGSYDEWVEQALLVSDNSYIILATSNSMDGDIHTTDTELDSDGWIFKINNEGNILWEKTIKAPPSPDNENYGLGLVETNDHRIVAAVSGYKVLDTAFYNTVFEWEGNVQIDTVRFNNIVCSPGLLYWIDPNTGAHTLFAETRGSDKRYFSMKASGNGIYFQYPDNNAWYQECIDYNNNNRYSYLPTESISTCYLDLATGQFTSTFFVTNEVVCPYSNSSGGNPNFFISPHKSLGVFSNNTWAVAGFNNTGSRGGTNHADALLFKQGSYGAYYGGDGVDGFNAIKVLPNDYELVCAGFAGSDNGDLIGLVHGATLPAGINLNADFWAVKVSIQPNRIVGHVFLDLNNNNVKDEGEPAYKRAIVKTVNDGLVRNAGVLNGYYEMIAGVDSFTTSLSLENNTYYSVTPAAKTTIFTAPNSIDTVDFAVHQVADVRDYVIALTALDPARPVRPVQYHIDYINKGTDTLLHQPVTFIKDSRLQFTTTPPGTLIIADTARWTIDSILPGETGQSSVTLTLPPIPAINMGDTLVSVVYIDSTNDITPADNSSMIRQPLLTSWDPNDKQEIHAGFFTPKDIDGGNYLTYTIRFQNTGNDTAFNILIRDTLDNLLNSTSLEMIAASHPYKISIDNGKFIRWQFDNIGLVDSLHNEPQSHGYITYRIKVENNLVDGDSILNSASIYFDFNPPVLTNSQITQVQIGKAIWTGAADDRWENPSNWNNHLVPDKDTRVIIPFDAVAFFPVIRQHITCYSIEIHPAASLIVTDGFDVIVRGK